MTSTLSRMSPISHDIGDGVSESAIISVSSPTEDTTNGPDSINDSTHNVTDDLANSIQSSSDEQDTTNTLVDDPNPTSQMLNSHESSAHNMIPPNIASALHGKVTASLYVGNLDHRIQEAELFNLFGKFGVIKSVRLCRDSNTKNSLGYAFVNFEKVSEAEIAMEKCNFERLNNRCIRIMWAQSDATLRKSGAGNIFIKNLSKKTTSKEIYHTFNRFGRILSCRVMVDDKGNSKGYGFIHYESEDVAKSVIANVDGKVIDSSRVRLCPFENREKRRERLGTTSTFNNIYIKNFYDHYTSNDLKSIFGKFGPIISAKVEQDSNGKSKGFGFVCYQNAESAAKAVEEMNDTPIQISFPAKLMSDDGKVNNKESGDAMNNAIESNDNDPRQIDVVEKKLYVGPAQKKAEREKMLKEKFEVFRHDRNVQHNGVNLYVCKLDPNVNKEILKEQFSKFGKVESVKVVYASDGTSRGYGFVRFADKDVASLVLNQPNLQIMNKDIQVALAQSKEQLYGKRTTSGNNLENERNSNAITEQPTNNVNTNGTNGNMLSMYPNFIPPNMFHNYMYPHRLISPPIANSYTTNSSVHPQSTGTQPNNGQPPNFHSNFPYVHSHLNPNRVRNYNGAPMMYIQPMTHGQPMTQPPTSQPQQINAAIQSNQQPQPGILMPAFPSGNVNPIPNGYEVKNEHWIDLLCEKIMTVMKGKRLNDMDEQQWMNKIRLYVSKISPIDGQKLYQNPHEIKRIVEQIYSSN